MHNNKVKNFLLCPQCMKEDLQRNETAALICTKCKISYLQNPSTFFYDFRSQAPNQGKGLLIRQETDFYSNDLFMQFVRANSLKNDRGIIEALNPEVILDIGCGNGLFAESLKGLFYKYIGFEPSDVPSVKSHLSSPSDNIFLFHDDVNKTLPLKDESIDLVLFMASYDHIPSPEAIVRNAWSKLKSGGHLMIVMSNYDFWIKKILNLILGKHLFKHDREHYCVHSPESLKKEILNFIPKAHLEIIDADYLYIPNLPKKISFLYFNYWWLYILDKGLKFMITSVLGMKHRGSTMTLVFKK
jgi:SAM-dependent methyltransferase